MFPDALFQSLCFADACVSMGTGGIRTAPVLILWSCIRRASFMQGVRFNCGMVGEMDSSKVAFFSLHVVVNAWLR